MNKNLFPPEILEETFPFGKKAFKSKRKIFSKRFDSNRNISRKGLKVPF